MAGLEGGSPLSVSAYPVGWRIEVVNDDIHRGFEYVRSGCCAVYSSLEQLTDPTH